MNKDFAVNNSDKLTMTLRVIGFLNASHYAVFDGDRGPIHSHSWQFQSEIEVPVNSTALVRFEDLEKIINETLKPYQRTVLNELPPFDRFQPFTENIAAHFYNTLADLLESQGPKLKKLVVWENPTKGVEIIQRLPYHLLAGQETDASIAPNVESTIPYDEPLNAISAAAASDYIDELADVGNQTSPEEVIECLPTNENIEPHEQFVTAQPSEKGPLKLAWWKWIIILLFILAIAIAAYYPLLAAPDYKVYPWGSDTWGHLYKAKFLAEQIGQGNYFPQFSADWYNGNQPFRYWAPLPYYVLAGLYYLTSNLFVAGNYYIFLCALLGALGCLFWCKRIPLGICILLAIIWLIWPDNVRVALAEGNLPRVLATALLPLLVACYLTVLEKGRSWGAIFATIVLIQLTILCHAMMGAVYGVALLLFTGGYWLFGGGSLKAVGRGVAVLIVGIMTSAWWLLPALSGGLVSMDSAALGGVQYISFLQSFDPTVYQVNRETAYLGISMLPLILLTVVTWKQKAIWAKTAFVVGLLLTLISFPAFSWLHKLLPLYGVLWPLRFRTLAGFMLLLSAASVNQKAFKTPSGKRKLLIATLLLLLLALADSGYVAKQLIFTRVMPAEVVNISNKIKEQNGWRVGTLDISSLGSAPSYFFSEAAEREQVFGWAWQGATTATNIMLLNTALENKLYPYVIKQLYFLGATDVITNQHGIKSPKEMSELLTQHGYRFLGSQGARVNYWHGGSQPYLIAAKPEGLAIGKFANMYALQYPSLQIASSTKIDDYTLEELAEYPLLILTGSNWNSHTQAEKLVIEYARQGGRVVVDLNGFPVDVFSKQPKFLNVYGQPLTLRGAMTATSKDGETMSWKAFESSNLPWATLVPLPLDEAEWTFHYMNSPATLYGYKDIGGAKIGFVGGNPVYHAFLTGDVIARQALGKWLGLSEVFVPPKIIPVQNYKVEEDGYSLGYHLTRSEKVVVPVAILDGMQADIDGQSYAIQSYENLVAIELPAGQHTLRLRIKSTPVYEWGQMVSAAAAGSMLLLFGPAAYLARRVKRSNKQIGKGERV